MVYVQLRICPGEWDAQTHQGFWDKNGWPNLVQMTRPYNKQQQQQKKENKIIVDFAVLSDHRVNLKETEKKDKYLDFARELKKTWNMKETVIPIIIGALGTVMKGLVKGLEDMEITGRVETIQTNALQRSVRIMRRVLETWGDLLPLIIQLKTIR